MTLSTNIIIPEPFDPERAFMQMAKIIGATEAYRWSADEKSFRAQLGQGLPALLDVHHNNGAPLKDDWYTSDPNATEVDEDGYPKSFRPTGYVLIDLDTAYGYGRNYDAASNWPFQEAPSLGHGGASDLHAFCITQFAMGTTGINPDTLWWQNEFTGDWFQGLGQLYTFGDAELGGRNPELRRLVIA